MHCFNMGGVKKKVVTGVVKKISKINELYGIIIQKKIYTISELILL